ncbi:Lrp/AsnC ligand binding domain-containing protein [Clostridium algidicarnis]|uniref:Lrp/AsnC family transcriptional regulator for asnA, asnC and gidA n=2 Tax=Clostridium algidicarnis TaxID=37659 RepID=A0A2S6FVH6_9CLOT|nr:Lrp/AsnC ligand binding domain-containing protein [Clostridium algidicarnis]MBB6630343.1 Lrp/AsnC ligand binding domain-containing protein [Clostridium algidicarnis]MBB6697754.1 Lrp/AsnC ligand binding domain-containing protein [Clostridium algidicarnis]MBU3192854.1 Lrp/AsnC ligand binding domain-containing protein [Clostridium algidicarnis]MBU3195232.1 Lrp/AsnC ligand binding domain-containing protein [Clostridium algidicarnis]MBU3203555.1 Lrp/AsnC ligand binding domain-containing protein 
MSLVVNSQLDDLDLQILDILIKDSRTPYLEIARICHVSGGTIHVRMKKMEDIGIIKGTKLMLDMPKLGYDVCCFVGVFVDKNSSFSNVMDEMAKIKEIVELHYTTGQYSVFAKVICKSISDLQDILMHRINTIIGIQSTDTFISLSQPIDRNIKL